MTRVDKMLVALCGMAFVVLGLGILSSGGLTLPSKTPPLRFHFAGVSLLMLGGAPLSLGLLCLALAGDRLQPRSSTTMLTFGFSMALIAAAFLVAPKF